MNLRHITREFSFFTFKNCTHLPWSNPSSSVVIYTAFWPHYSLINAVHKQSLGTGFLFPITCTFIPIFGLTLASIPSSHCVLPIIQYSTTELSRFDKTTHCKNKCYWCLFAHSRLPVAAVCLWPIPLANTSTVWHQTKPVLIYQVLFYLHRYLSYLISSTETYWLPCLNQTFLNPTWYSLGWTIIPGHKV